MDCILEFSVSLAYVWLVRHAISSGVSLMTNVLFAMVMCILHSLSNRKSVRAMGDLEHACCLSLGRCNEPPYLADMYLARPWYMVPYRPRSLTACISCWPMRCM